MLVLSRKLDQKVLLPAVDVSIKVVDIRGGVVRLGIDAPPEVTVLREEVPDRRAEWGDKRALSEPTTGRTVSKDLLQQVHERLRTTGVGLALLSLELDAGLIADAKTSLAQIRDDLRLLRIGLEGELDVPPTPSSPGNGRRKKALLVEDDCYQRELLAGFLRQTGIEVDTAGDGADALDYLRTHDKPDVVLLDMALPRIDGPTMVREIRRNPALAGLKVFGVSGHSPEEFDLDPRSAGIDRWFQKPLDLNTLLQHLTPERDGSSFRA
jgi:carbon storage regulator CsrA